MSVSTENIQHTPINQQHTTSYRSSRYDDVVDKIIKKRLEPFYEKNCFYTKNYKSNVGHINADDLVEHQNKSKSELPNNVRFQFQSEIAVMNCYKYSKNLNEIDKKNLGGLMTQAVYGICDEIYDLGDETLHLFKESDNGYYKELVDVTYDVAMYSPRQAARLISIGYSTTMVWITTGIIATGVSVAAGLFATKFAIDSSVAAVKVVSNIVNIQIKI